MKKITFLLLAITLFSSCAKMIIKTAVPYQKTQQNIKIALFPVMIGKVEQPIFPLIDASMFNKRTNKIADQIMDMQKKEIDKIREVAANTIKKYIGSEIIYSENLHKTERFKNLIKTNNYTNSLIIENDNFPVVLISSGDINPYKYTNGNVISYFKESNNYKETIINLCKELDVDAIVINYSNLNIIGVTAFGGSANIRLDTYLYVISKNGELLGNGYAYSKPIVIKGKEITDYKMVIDEYPNLFEALVNALANPQNK